MVFAERLLMVGEFSPDVVVNEGTLTSWLTSRLTKPPALIWGVTDRITPVSRYCTELTTTPAAPTDCGPATGTLSPTWILAVWLSATMMWGEDRMFSLLSLASMFSTDLIVSPALDAMV